MTMARPVPARALGLDSDGMCWLGSAVLPMGWLLAVLVFQHIHRRLGLRGLPRGAALPADEEWRHD